ncbi:MAG: menaquinone biosynthetic enzyme MqnA/MqnD family protein [Candidatus Entotheonellia bacterium]
MALRIGRVPYLHAEPFYVDMARRGLALTELVPRAIAVAAAHGEIDAGPVPLVDCFRLEDRFQPLAGFCVASVQHAGSSLLFSTKPIAALAEARIGVTDETSTALQLLHVLLRLKYQVQPAAYVPLQASYDAFLLIGNQGLRQRMGAPGFPYTYDLGAEWYAWTGLPFVFSRWLVRKEVDPKDKALLEERLYVGLEEGVDALCQLATPRQDLLMLPRDIVKYIQGFRYYIGRSEQRAMDQFRHCLQQLER